MFWDKEVGHCAMVKGIYTQWPQPLRHTILNPSTIASIAISSCEGIPSLPLLVLLVREKDLLPHKTNVTVVKMEQYTKKWTRDQYNFNQRLKVVRVLRLPFAKPKDETEAL